MMERGLRGKVAALGAAVVLCAGGSLLGSSPQDTAAVVPACTGSWYQCGTDSGS